MKTLSKGQKVKSQYGKILTVKEVIENTVWVVEEYNNSYHITKVWTI